MGQVSDYLVELIKKQVVKRGIVVWYDPPRKPLNLPPEYEGILGNLDFGGIPVLRYAGSYFRLRKDLELFLSGSEPGKCVIYVPAERKRGSSPLVEAESAGQIMEPGAVTGANTRLEVIARAVLSEVLATENVEEICKSVAKGSLNIEDLDKIAEQGKEAGKGALGLIFGTSSTEEMTLIFLSSREKDKEIIEKNGISELAMLLKASLGFSRPIWDLPSLRKDLAQHILLSEFLACLTDQSIHEQYKQTTKADKPSHVDVCRRLASVWRHRLDLRDSYEAAASQVEGILDVRHLQISGEEMIHCETFPCTETWVSRLVCEKILNDETAKALEIVSLKKGSFWSVMDPLGLVRWNLLEIVARLIRNASELKKALGQKDFSLSNLAQQYVQDTEEAKGWYALDYDHRLLEKQYATYDVGMGSREEDLIAKTVAKARHAYMEAAGLLSEAFSKYFGAGESSLKGIAGQQNIFRDHVKERIEKGKTAYLWVDALRYEMGKELFGALQEFPNRKIYHAFAVIPTITSVGMAALLPGAEDGLRLLATAEGLLPQIGEVVLKDRKNRFDWLRKKVNGKVAGLKLGDIVKPTKKTKDEIGEADLVIVTSQEIDEICEGDNIHLARKVMNDVLDELIRGIRNLHRLGVEHFVITADHGYLFGEELSEAMKVDPPGGKEVALHRRFWAGLGGKQDPSFVRIKASKLGLCDDLELAFPKGLAGFKAKGGARAYFHGGISPQEIIIPVITISAGKKRAIEEGEYLYEMTMERQKITARFFTVKTKFSWKGLFGDDKKRVKILVMSGNKELGSIATAVYGHGGGTSKVVLEKEKENHVTLMLQEGVKEKSVDIIMLDDNTGKELDKIGNIPLALTF